MILRNSVSTASSRLLVTVLTAASLLSAQTFTSCNPLLGTCPPNPALSGTITHDFTGGAGDGFAAVGSSDKISYGPDGATFQVATSGNSPTLASNFYIMFGRVDVTMRSAPGVGIVSSVVLQSDDLDEIDWEWLGGDNVQVQSNYFGKGNTNTYDRAAFITVDNPQGQEHTYTIEWTSQAITWSVDGIVRRLLTVESSSGGGQYYPQTPMQIKVGAWSGGDPSNPPGTIQWSGGYTDYSQGPFNMYVRNIHVEDYSTGESYYYSDTSGSYTSIRSNGGEIGVNNLGSSGVGGGTNNNNNNNIVSPEDQPTLTNIPIDGGIPTATMTLTRTPYTQPTSAEEYWAGTGFRVSSASTLSTNPTRTVITEPYIVTDDSPTDPAVDPSFPPPSSISGLYIVTTSATNRSGGGRRLTDLTVFASSSPLFSIVFATGWGLLLTIFLL